MLIARRIVGLGLAVVVLAAAAAGAADTWRPAAFAEESTLQFQTTDPGDAPHWSTVWLVVLDDAVYVRLGSRAAGRVARNVGGDVLPVRVAGEEFARVRFVPAPDRADAVARAMADKYWSDVFVRWMDHPLTARLEPEETPGG